MKTYTWRILIYLRSTDKKFLIVIHATTETVILCCVHTTLHILHFQFSIPIHWREVLHCIQNSKWLFAILIHRLSYTHVDMMSKLLILPPTNKKYMNLNHAGVDDRKQPLKFVWPNPVPFLLTREPNILQWYSIFHFFAHNLSFFT